jgi:PAS domain S-box-containing protein
LLRELLRGTALRAVETDEALWAALGSDYPLCLCIDESFCDGEVFPEALVEALQNRRPNAPRLWALARETNPETWGPLRENPSDDFVLRPFRPQELLARLRRMLSMAGRAPELQQANRVLAAVIEERSHDLYESDERFRLLFNACTDGVCTVSVGEEKGDDHIIEVNSQLCHALNYPREEILNMLPKDLVDPHYIKAMNARTRTLAVDKQMYIETILVTRDGHKIPATITARYFSFSRQPYIIFVVHFRARGEAGAPDNDLDYVYRTYAMQTGQIMYEYTIPTEKVRLSGATNQITGLSVEDLESMSREECVQLVHGDDRKEFLHRIAQAVSTIGEFHMQYRVRHISGEYRHVEDLGIVVPGESGEPQSIFGTVKDITDRVRAEQDERIMEQELQHSKRLESLGVLAGGIAHDFNNILAAIIGLTDMSIQELDGPPDVLEDLEESLRAAHRAKDLVKQILAFSRQTGEEHIPVHLHAVVREALGLLRASIPNSINIVDKIDSETGMVLANPTQMHQVVMNYCTNGVQAMTERGGSLEVRLEEVEVTRRFAAVHPKLHPGPYLKLTVADRGRGIEPVHLRRIFDPFYTTKGPGEGTGMGLAMVYGIVADHGGAVFVESVLGQGTEFHTYLPRIAMTADGKVALTEGPAVGRESILVVDDERAIRRFCQRSLTPLGYRIHCTGEPEVALAEFKRDPSAIDLVITDQHMPGMTGDSLARRLRKVRADIPIILFTGYSSEISEEAARDAGIDEVVPKPVLASQLTTAIRRVLEAARRA